MLGRALLVLFGAVAAVGSAQDDSTCHLEVQRFSSEKPQHARNHHVQAMQKKQQHLQHGLKNDDVESARASSGADNKQKNQNKKDTEKSKSSGSDDLKKKVDDKAVAKTNSSASNDLKAKKDSSVGVASEKSKKSSAGSPAAHAKHKKKANATFAVTTRIYRAELPYLKPFLSHYVDKLSTNRIYLFCTNPSEESMIAEKVKDLGYKKQVQFLGAKDPQKLQKLNYSAVNEDWIIDVDVDEFLRPPEHSLQKLVDSEPDADMFELQWLCYPSDTTHEIARPYPLPCVGLKGMVRTKAFIPDDRGVYDVHGGEPRCTEPCKVGKTRYILDHLQYRGFYDALLRDISSPEGSQWMLKGQPKDVAFKKLRQGEPGNRLKSLAFEMVCLEAFGRGLVRNHENIYGTDHAPQSMKIDLKLQSEILKESGVDKELDGIALKGYLNYKATLRDAFKNLLCDPKEACDIRPSHVTNLLSNMTVKDVKRYSGPCHKGVALEA